MRKLFRSYYRPSNDEFAQLWKECLFALDANVLLNLYRYTPDTREELLGILGQIADRLWIPHQAALEYQQNRLKVIADQKAVYKKLQEVLRQGLSTVEGEFGSRARHPFIDIDSTLRVIKNAFKRTIGRLEQLDKAHPDLMGCDHIRDKLTTLLEDRVGNTYTEERLDQIRKEGEARYDKDIPPGFADKGKRESRQYGDLILWYQVIDKAKEARKPVILVTDERKEDWWVRFQGRTIGPRPELIEEVLAKAGVSLYMYAADPFMEHATKYLARGIREETIKEVRTVRERQETLLEEQAAVPEVVRLAVQAEEHRRRYLGLPSLAALAPNLARLAPNLAALVDKMAKEEGSRQPLLESLAPGLSLSLANLAAQAEENRRRLLESLPPGVSLVYLAAQAEENRRRLREVSEASEQSGREEGPREAGRSES